MFIHLQRPEGPLTWQLFMIRVGCVVSCLQVGFNSAIEESSIAFALHDVSAGAVVLQHQLHVDHVEPLAELVAHLLEERHLLKPMVGMKGDACGIVGRDAGYQRMIAA